MFIIDEMDQVKAKIKNLLRRHPFIRSNFGFDLMRRGIEEVLENYDRFLNNKKVYLKLDEQVT